jgi:hypothetical protein
MEFLAIFRHIGGDAADPSIYERQVDADDLDEAARLAIRDCPEDLFVAAVVDGDQLQFVRTALVLRDAVVI